MRPRNIKKDSSCGLQQVDWFIAKRNFKEGKDAKKHIGAWLDLATPEAMVAKFHDPKTRK